MNKEAGIEIKAELVLVRPAEVEEKTGGGIVLPKMTMDKEGIAARYGVLIDAGKIARQHPRLDGIEFGDTVLFTRYAADFFPRNGVKYMIMRVDQILAKLDEGVVPDYALNAARAPLEAA